MTTLLDEPAVRSATVQTRTDPQSAMVALLSEPSIRSRLFMFPVEVYRRMGEAGLLGKNVELLRGVVIRKMPKSPLHDFISHVVLERLLSSVPPGFIVRHEAPLTTDDSEPEPDLSVVEGKRTDWLNTHPTTAMLVVEISVSTRAVDEWKAGLYAESGVSEYWLIRPEAREVDVYRDPRAEGYAMRSTSRDGDTLDCVALPAVKIAVSDIFPPRGA